MNFRRFLCFLVRFFDAEHEIIDIENYLLELPSAINIIGLPFWDIHWYYIAKSAKNTISNLQLRVLSR